MAKNDWAVVDSDMTARIGCAVEFFPTKAAAQEFISALNKIPENEARFFSAERADKVFSSGNRPVLMPAEKMPKLPD